MPTNRITLSPTAKRQLVRLEELLKSADAVETPYEASHRRAKENPNDSMAKLAVDTAGFFGNASYFMKEPSPTLTMRIRQALNEIAPDTEYVRDIGKKDTVEEHSMRLRAVIEELKSGNLNSIYELAHAEIYDDVLDESQHLSDQGYLIAAAITAGSAAEAHLKRLAKRNAVDVVDSQGKPYKADTINAGLVKKGVYNKTVQKHVTAWQAVRNDAAHGDAAKVTASLAQGIIDGLMRFIADYPA